MIVLSGRGPEQPSDVVPDFYGAEPWPEDFEEDEEPTKDLREGCAHEEVCSWVAWSTAEHCGEPRPDRVALDEVLTDQGVCGRCPYREVGE